MSGRGGFGGFGAFLRKEMLETRATWRLWVLPGVLVFLGLTTPIMTAITPWVLKRTAASTPGVSIHYPTPTALDSYIGFMGNLAELALLALIISVAASVASERRGGTAVLVLTKPLSRAAFITAKCVANLILVTASTALGAAACIVVTILLFDASHVAAFVESVAVWLVLAAMFTTLMVLLSAAMDRQAPAAGVGIGVYVALFVLTGFPIAKDRTPAGIMAANDAILKAKDVALGVPLAVTAVLTVVFAVAAIYAFRRKEL